MMMATMLALSTAIVPIAHRGLHGPGRAQNSTDSFKAAYAAGAKWIETDFWSLKNGRIICVHDPVELEKVSGVKCKSISKLTDEEIAAIDIGKAAKTEKPVHMPYLEDVLACVPKDAHAQCEIKFYGPGFAEKFDAAVRAAGLTEANIAVSSFRLDWVKDFRRRFPKYRTIWLGAGVSGKGTGTWDVDAAIAQARAAKVDVICPGAVAAKKAGVTRADADKVRAAGLDFRFFGVNNAQMLGYANELGVTGFTCDHWKDAFEWAKNIPGLTLQIDYARGDAEARRK